MARGSSWNGFESVTVNGSAGGLTTATIAGQRNALITVETAQIRFTIDGTTVTASAGHVLNAGDVLELDSFEALTAFSAIRTGGTSATIRCSYGY